jgi:DNA polymerase III alpha subunit
METSQSLTNKYGQVILDSNKLRELLLRGKNISHTVVSIDDELELYNKFQSSLLPHLTVFNEPPDEDFDFDKFQANSAAEWLIPEEYQNIDVRKWLLDKCSSQEEIDRVNTEFILFEERELIMLLRFFIYLVSYMRENKFLWGVGRGSSVASFILYLIGIHRVHSIRFGLEIRDYLK